MSSEARVARNTAHTFPITAHSPILMEAGRKYQVSKVERSYAEIHKAILGEWATSVLSFGSIQTSQVHSKFSTETFISQAQVPFFFFFLVEYMISLFKKSSFINAARKTRT